ncbi:putative N-acetylmannosamine-6-phosphate 2-epimerase [Halolactibacillus alkaliphilus]|uniref:Putative N-acetylmannosamine-6-phosphate 2-epimerase n=1 Tax=Halolactibacillus alkaliphilus TaxID=442899 RepID=A0A511WZM9_9BACI|nr:N-acetylmannosamine-6-phosphate 2-epimerase [Halolactibacillus alkaliphilus]GEN56153.1 putative N-acetylmannosamine-6-phosphate 2-epimerase [Halolactibacillus alkaliphilus]GGN66863.1 putative N-acetylmannosamine-6-phosphate 2-epimerase [Halolactibacillus alkaliphilus]SFO71992.1 N-acylglucosamine-6-phosphate 2-epimerase [Halolactibacillus alkaliphilus]
MKNSILINKLKGGLIVSCQALENEPLHGSSVMAKMARAAEIGGAVGLRANGISDIKEIKKVTDLPVIGLIKRDYSDSPVYITPTKKEVDELISVGVDMIALDATKRTRPNQESLSSLITYLKKNNQCVMADISTYEEAIDAINMGVDVVSTTLSGYTAYTEKHYQKPNIELVEQLVEGTNVPVFSEGNVDSPQVAKAMLKAGAHAVVVGSAITRPQLITEKFVLCMRKELS